MPDLSTQTRLGCVGVCNRCAVWLSGQYLGSHEGMFGAQELEVTGLLADESVLLVEPAPIRFESARLYPANNASRRKTVVINNVYGWPYPNLQSPGIWDDVRLVEIPDVEMVNPFISPTDHDSGEVHLHMELSSETTLGGRLVGQVSPHDFERDACHF